MKCNKVMVVLLLATALGACQQNIFKGFGSSKRADASATSMQRANIEGLIALEEGRAYLKAGQISAAVASFKIARMDRSVAADATNGLGVAYAKLGRSDIADRYFRQALRFDPANQRYAANLMRLQRQVFLAGARKQDLATVEVERVADAPDPVKTVELANAERSARRPVINITTNQQLAPAPKMEVLASNPSKTAPQEEAAVKSAKAEAEEEGTRVKLLSRLSAGPLEVVF